jgi:hypothetical protein
MTEQKPKVNITRDLDGFTLAKKDYEESLKTTFAPDKKVEEAFKDYEEL